jgi:hypothetical protein
MNKIWVLGGPFYLSLLVLIIGFWIGDKRVKKYLSSGVIVCAALMAVYFSFIQFGKIGFNPKLFFLSVDAKQDQMMVGQYSYVNHLRKILPKSATGCVLQSTDLPAYYLRNQLYPRKFSLTKVLSKNCDYIVSQFSPVNIKGFILVDKYKGNYLYKLKN